MLITGIKAKRTNEPWEGVGASFLRLKEQWEGANNQRRGDVKQRLGRYRDGNRVILGKMKTEQALGLEEQRE